MVKTKQTKKVNVDATLTPSNLQTELGGRDWTLGQETDVYVVTRGGFRVSDNEYISPDWPEALQEKNFWMKVSSRSKDGNEVKIEKYDKKKHRVY